MTITNYFLDLKLTIYNTVSLVRSVIGKFLERNFLFIKKVQAFLDLIFVPSFITVILVRSVIKFLDKNSLYREGSSLFRFNVVSSFSEGQSII